MSLGEVLDTAFRLVRDHFTLLVGISFTVSLPVILLGDAAADLGQGSSVAAAGGLVGIALSLVIISPFVSAAITHAISEVYLGRPVGLAESLKAGLRLWLRLIGTSFLMTLLITVGFLLLIIPGIYLLFAFMLTYQIIVIEDLGGWNALKRSRELTKNNLLRILAISLVATVLMIVIGTGLGLVSAQVPYLGTLLDAVAQSVFNAFMSAAFVVLYFDIRCRKEAFDLEHLAQLVNEEQAPAAVTG